MKTVQVTKPSVCDQAIAGLYCKKNGLPESEREWVCQHSCAPETIPGCTDFNCEGTTIVNRSDLAKVCGLIEKGDLTLFDDMPVELKLTIDTALAKSLTNFALPKNITVTSEAKYFLANGSLINFVKLTARRLELPHSKLRTLLAEIEATLSWQFHPVGPALFYQRFADLRQNKNERGNVLVFLAYDAQPIIVAWETPPKWKKKKPNPRPEIPVAKLAFGLITESGKTTLTFTERGVHSVPGDYYGPYMRIFFRVDQKMVDDVRALCEASEKNPISESADERLVMLLSQITKKLGVAAPTLPLTNVNKEKSFAQSHAFLFNFLLMQPLT